jgi:phosphate acetyltransferase
MIRAGRGELLMKGSLHTDELMHAVADKLTGLQTERRISHVYVMDVPGHAETLFITDAAINIFPDLSEKRDIVQNAIDLFIAIGLGTPRVAILSAVETVTPKIPSTIEAAALCKMADRGQITGGVLDGPLAFDNAIDPEAAPTVPSKDPKSRIDYIFYRQGDPFEVVETKVIAEEMASDHRPVFAVLRVKE